MIFETRAFVLADKTKKYTSKKDKEDRLWREISVVGKDDTTAIPVHIEWTEEQMQIKVRRDYDFKFAISYEWNKINLKVVEMNLVELEK